jgi:cytochrome c biogenesis protein CcdA
MNRTVSLVAVGHASSIFLMLTFILCVAFDFLFPAHAMFRAWQDLLPGFEWISWKSFFLGIVESYAYGWYFALIWVPLYNYFVSRGEKAGNKEKKSCCQ